MGIGQAAHGPPSVPVNDVSGTASHYSHFRDVDGDRRPSRSLRSSPRQVAATLNAASSKHLGQPMWPKLSCGYGSMAHWTLQHQLRSGCRRPRHPHTATSSGQETMVRIKTDCPRQAVPTHRIPVSAPTGHEPRHCGLARRTSFDSENRI